MIGTREMLEDIVLIPFPERQNETADTDNTIALKLRDAFAQAYFEQDSGEPVFAPSTLYNLDKLPGADLFLAIAAVAATVEDRSERTQDSDRKSILFDLGRAARELAELYRPIPPSPRRPHNNPYGIGRGHDPSLSYQPGAMRHRSGRGR